MEMPDILNLFKLIGIYYPQANKGDLVEKYEAWEPILLKHDADIIFANLQDHVETSQYIPTLSELIRKPKEAPRTVPSIEETKARIKGITSDGVAPDEIHRYTPRMRRNLGLDGDEE